MDNETICYTIQATTPLGDLTINNQIIEIVILPLIFMILFAILLFTIIKSWREILGLINDLKEYHKNKSKKKK